VALAANLVSCELEDLADLPAQLLGRTLIVRDLAAAQAIAAQTNGYRFVTLAGELLELDGTLTTGRHHAETGILSRKSELRELRQQAEDLDRRSLEVERDLAEARDRLAVLDGKAEGIQEEIEVLTEQAADLRTRVGQHRQRREGLHEEVTLSRGEISGVSQDIERLETAWQQARAEAEAAEQRVQALHARLEAADREVHACEHQRQQHQQEVTAAKVALAKTEERLVALRTAHRRALSDLEQRRQEHAQAEARLTAFGTRWRDCQLTMLRASSLQAEQHLEKDSAEGRLESLTREREVLREHRQSLAEIAQTSRSAWLAQQEQAHARELEVSDFRHRREALVSRLHEDYQLDLGERYRVLLEAPSTAPLPDAPLAEFDPRSASLESEAVDAEIAELRRKLNRLGSVNLDSLQELTDLETRAGSLQVQFDDLTAAKSALEEIIGKINQDSRRLFAETLATIRTHFQELFRKLFGGGMADIVLEDESDILESGIEIIARPPGKELRSISLMSGGEKTMTAVALLLAIFRSKPSPFCILDEVDAALDEANIGRFTAVLREFLDRSHFILITHSKRTMASADVLYGITMQESGISKRVSVRFEDWPDDQSAEAESAA
jgi:chromosome segregation protein